MYEGYGLGGALLAILLLTVLCLLFLGAGFLVAWALATLGVPLMVNIWTALAIGVLFLVLLVIT